MGNTIEEIGQPPDFVLEVASVTTAENDETTKRAQYAEMGVGEYWRFDWSGRGYYRTPLAGDVLVEGEYRAIPMAEGDDGLLRGHSPALGLDLVGPSCGGPPRVGRPRPPSGSCGSTTRRGSSTWKTCRRRGPAPTRNPAGPTPPKPASSNWKRKTAA